MGHLDEALIALVGPIDNALDDGVGFRRDIMQQIKAAGLNVHFFDPTNKPTGGFKEIGYEKQHAFNLRAQRKFKELKQFVHTFRRQDLRAVHVSDIVIAYIDTDIHLCGTYDEVFTAEREGKPRYAVVKGGVQNASLWLFDVFDDGDMFDSVDELVFRLVSVDQGKYPFDPTWMKASVFLRESPADK